MAKKPIGIDGNLKREVGSKSRYPSGLVVETGNTTSPQMLAMLRRPEGASLEELLALRRVTDKPKATRLAAVLKVVKEFKNKNGHNVIESGDRFYIKS